MFRALAFSALAVAGLAQATINNMRGTIPGSLHQCQNTSIFFFDTDDSGSKTLLLVPSPDAASLGSGIIYLNDALAKTQPLQTISNINSADATEFDFFLKVAEGASFSTFGFLSDGQGKNLNLDRTVQAPLPGAVDCLSEVVAPVSTTSIPVLPAPAATTSGFVTSTRPKTTSTSTMTTVQSGTTTVPAPAPVTPAIVKTAPKATLSKTSLVVAPSQSFVPGTVVVDTKYLLTSFINISKDKTTDGTVTSAPILGGHVTGTVNGTIAPFGAALFSVPSNVTAEAAIVTNTTADTTASLLSATYTMLLDDGEILFVSAQTPLSTNFTTDALVIDVQPAFNGTSMFSNLTLIGKPESINSTMFRIDTYYVKN